MRRVPTGGWGLTWFVVLCVVTAVVVRLELFVRDRGFQPSIKEDGHTWALQRARASGSARTLAIAGTSRILLAFSSPAFRAALPGWRSVQLAIEGSKPIVTLRDLAFDPDFRGVALVEIVEAGFEDSAYQPDHGGIRISRRGWREVGTLAERWLTTRVQARVALLASGGLRTLGSLLRHGSWPDAPYAVTYPDRTKFANYDRTDVARRRREQVVRLKVPAVLTDPAVWLGAALAQELFVAMIHARGGEVVFLRMPTCVERWAMDERLTPKAAFWDQLAAHTAAVTIHFKDHPTLSSFDCPDTSHIASKDGPRFTRALIEVLVARGVLQRAD